MVLCLLCVLTSLREELGKNINADEAAAMGAVYQAAALSKAFKVKPFLVRDVAVFPIQVVQAVLLFHHITSNYLPLCTIVHSSHAKDFKSMSCLDLHKPGNICLSRWSSLVSQKRRTEARA